MPNPLTLFPASNGYRRRLYDGRAVSVYYDHHPRNEWGEHTREQEQVSAFLNEAAGLLKWKPPGGEWRELKLQGPIAWLIPANTPHALDCSEEAEMVTLFIEREFAAEIMGGEPTEVMIEALAHLIGREALIGQLAKAFRRLCRGRGTANALYIESIGTVFGSHLLRGLLGGDATPHRRGGLPDEALQRVTSHIDKHAGDCLDLAVLGRAAGFSSSHFGRLFKTSMDMTPHEYVMRRRVAKAEELLQQTDKKEVEIALLCGFSDDTLMARWFRRILGCRPSEIRAQRVR
ncbi:MAG: AraC family transcriptional regulator [Opitutaceae bacterium]